MLLYSWIWSQIQITCESPKHWAFKSHHRCHSKVYFKMSSSNNNNNNISNNNNNNNGISGKCDESYCSSCMHQSRSCSSGISRSGSMNGNSSFNNNNVNGTSGGYGIGVGGGVGGIPPIQVTAKVLFGSVSAISALNAERKKKTAWSSKCDFNYYRWRYEEDLSGLPISWCFSMFTIKYCYCLTTRAAFLQ